MAVTYSQNGVIVKPTGFDVIGGKKYKTVQMPDGKIWLAENLDFKFCDIGGSGTNITSVKAWYCNNDESTYGWNGYKCGLLYNWYAVTLLNDNRADLCLGWHVPTKDEWNTLITACGGASAGNKLKALDGSAGTSWPSSWNGTDDYGFGALPAGYRSGSTGVFASVGTHCVLWSNTGYSSNNAWRPVIQQDGSISVDSRLKTDAYTIRLVRDAT